MKRTSLLLLFVVAAMLLSSPSFATNGYCPFQFPNVNPFDLLQYAPFQMRQGFDNGEIVWYICTDVSDLQLANQQQLLPSAITVQLISIFGGVNFAPRLVNLAGEVPIVYIVTGQAQPVFTAFPGDPNYSGIWQVVYVTFNRGVTRHCVNNAEPFNPITNPTGLPSAAEATFTTVNRAGNPIIVKYPIMAVGRLGGPWQPAPGNTTDYRIAQGRVYPDYAYTKIIFLPFWNIYCQDPITKRVDVRQIVIPDAFDPPGTPVEDQLVAKLGANSAPGLGLLTDMQNFYWQQGPQPSTQYPILQACPTAGTTTVCVNMNYQYTPVERVVVLQRNVPPLPQSTVITNESVLLDFLSGGCLSEVRSDQVIDGTVLQGLRYIIIPGPIGP